MQRPGQRGQERNVRIGRALLPFADRRAAHAELLGKLLLRHAQPAPVFPDGIIHFQHVVSPPVDGSGRAPRAFRIAQGETLCNGGVVDPQEEFLNGG